MRVAHLTDIHVERRPRADELLGKRLLGSVNLYLLGRHGHFSPRVQQRLVEAVGALEPDAVVCTGDLTAQALPAEFEAARALLDPLLAAAPWALIPGNHDTYTRGAAAEARIERHFGPSVGSGSWPRRFDLGGGQAAIALQTCRAHPLSSGRAGADQIARLDAILADPTAFAGRALILLHYPLRDRRGAPYGPATRDLRDARAVEAVLARHPRRIRAILHGHEHHGFRAELPAADGSRIPILNPGASGYAWLPERRRTAHFTLLTLPAPEADAPLAVERFAYDGAADAFVPEPGGPFATGR